jgi:hypothetical protein
MFTRSSSRPQPVDCFFCLSPSLLPPSNSSDVKGKGKGRMGEVGSKWNWYCERCGCWNVRDEVSLFLNLMSRSVIEMDSGWT